MKTPKRSWPLIALVTVVSSGWSGASAQVGTAAPETRYALQLRAGAHYSDNIGRVESVNRDSELFGSLGAIMAMERRGPRVDASLGGTLDYFHYGSDEFSNEVVGRVDGYVGAALLPERIDWIVRNRFGQVRTDPFNPESPDNREYLNVLETGPDFYMPLGVRTFASAAARYFNRAWERSDQLDSEVWQGQAAINRSISPTQQVGLGGSVRRIEFDAPAFAFPPRYDVQSVFGTYRRVLATGDAGVDLGANRLRWAGQTRTGLLLRGDWTRELGARSRLTLRAGREFQDTGDQFGRGRLDETRFTDTGDRARAADPFEETFVSAAYSLDRGRSTFGFGAALRFDRYEESTDLDRDTVELTAGVSHEFTPMLRGDARLRWRREDFTRFDTGSANDYGLQASLFQRLGRQLDLAGRYRYSERDGNVGRDYREHRFTVELIWTPGERP